jgi:hypothetical protein
VPEHPGREDRDGDERGGLAGRGRLVADHVVGGHGHLADVELAVAEHPEEDLLRIQREVAQVSPGHGDPAVGEGPGAVVGAAGQRDWQQ